MLLLSFLCPSAGSFTRVEEFDAIRATAVLHIIPRDMANRAHGRNQIEFSVCRTSPKHLVVLMAALNETDLYAPVKRLLEEQGYTVRAEVDRWDLVAVRGGEPPVIVELKRRFALSLFCQGIGRAPTCRRCPFRGRG